MRSSRKHHPGRALDAVVIGASAGGVDALSILLPALPAKLKVPVFIVLHLPREHPSMLVDIFKTRCERPIREARDKEPVEAGTVYFAPPDYHLLVDRERQIGPQLALSADPPVHYARPSIDVLFESAADIYAERIIGVVLTGANQDGASGLKAIHDGGGISIVQEPATAYASLMPESALKQTPADFILPLDEIARLFRTLADDKVMDGLHAG